MLDIGCGMGEPIASYLIEKGHRVTGVDSSASMIELCRRRFPKQQWHVADMRSLHLNCRFDGLLAWDSFFHLTPEHQRAMFEVFAAHAAPRGVLMFTSGPAHGEAIAEFEGDPVYHASLDPDEYRRHLDVAGFAVISHVAQDPHCQGHTVWLAQRS